MKVLHVSYHKSWRGGEQQISYLVGELHKMGCQQWIYCSENNALENYCQENGIPNYTFSNRLLSRFSNARQLKHICEKHVIDIIHVHDSMSHMMAYLAGLSGNTVPIILSRRVDFAVRNSPISRKKYNYSGIKKIICVSEKIKHTLEPDIKDKSKLTIVHDGIDLDRFGNTKSTGILRKQYHIPENANIIGNVAALSPIKDYFTFIDTAEILISKKPDLYFFIIGEGKMKKKLQDYIDHKGLTKYFIFTGFRKDIQAIMPELDVFLFTSINEGLGTSILDAFAAGIPVVSTNAGGIPEMVEHNKTGLLADVKDSKTLAEHVLSLLNNESLRNDLVNNAREKVKFFSKQIMAEKTFGYYEEILKTIEDIKKEKESTPYSLY
jgi:L-malate glycosyltransferase